MPQPEETTGQQLPARTEAATGQAARTGITFSRDMSTRPSRTRAIHWQPGDPDPLATAIINHVTEPMLLELDGRLYRIEPLR